MKETRHSIFLKNKPIAYNYAMGGIEIYDIEYGTDDYVYAKSYVNTDKPHFHHVKINYTKGGDPFIYIFGIKLELASFIRCNSPWCS